MIRITVRNKINERGEPELDIFLGDSEDPCMFITIPHELYEETISPVLINLVEQRSYAWENETHDLEKYKCKDHQSEEEKTPQDGYDQSKDNKDKNNILGLDGKPTKH